MEKNTTVEKLIDDIYDNAESCIDYTLHSFDYDGFVDKIRPLIENAMKQSE